MGSAKIQNLKHLSGTIAVFGDTHGVWAETMEAIDALNPDHIVFLGDICDRGPASLKLFEYVRSNANVYSLMGNHENKFSRWLNGNPVKISKGLKTTIDEVEAAGYTDDQKNNLRLWLNDLPHIIKLPDNYVCVHAGFNPTKALKDQAAGDCIRIRSFGTDNMDDENALKWYQHKQCADLSKRKILYGHSYSDVIKVAPNCYSLDGGAVYGGELRVLLYDTNTKTEQIYKYPCPQYFSSSESETSRSIDLLKAGVKVDG